MANTPDKTGSNKPAPKPLDIMSRNVWTMEPGYRKAPHDTAAGTAKVAAETRALAQPQTQPPAQQTREKESPATQEAAAAQPNQSQPEGPRAAARGEPAPAPAKLTPSFAVATSLPFHILAQAAYAAPGRESTDPHAEHEARLIADAKDPTTATNNFSAQRIAANSAMAASKAHRSDTEKDEDAERHKKKDSLLYRNLELINNIRSDLDNELNLVNEEITSCKGRIKILERNIQIADQQIAAEKSDIQSFETGRQQQFHATERIYSQKIYSADDKLQAAEKDYQTTLANANPAAEAKMRDQAWTENRDKIREQFEQAGFGMKFDQMTKDQQNAALVKYLKENDPDNPFLQTAEAKKVIRDEAKRDLHKAQNEYLNVIQNKALRIYQKTGERIEAKQEKIKTIESRKEADLEKLEEEKKNLGSLEMKKEKINAYRQKLDAIEERMKNGDESAYDDLRTLQKEMEQRKRDVIHSRGGNAFSGRPFGQESASGQTAQTGTSSNAPPRTSTDSAAGLVNGSALAQADGLAKQPFNKAASGTATPDSAATPEATLAATAEQQKRQQFAATGLNA